MNKIPTVKTLTNDADSHSWGFENFEVIKTEEDAKIFVETMENIPEPNDKLKKAFRDFNKQETLEEAAENYAIDKQNENASKYYIALESFQEGAKWQQERSYSEEEVLKLLISKEENTKDSTKYNGVEHITPEEWFEQCKKK